MRTSAAERKRRQRANSSGYLKSRAVDWRLQGIVDGTPERFMQLLELQGNICPICEHSVGIKDCLDHDHATGMARGVIHARCNHLVGLFENFMHHRVNENIAHYLSRGDEYVY